MTTANSWAAQSTAGEGAPPPKFPWLRPVIITVLVIGGLVGAGALAAEVFGIGFPATRGADGQITESGLLNLEELRPADCVEDSPDRDSLAVAVVPCSDPHESVVAEVTGLSYDSYPGKDILNTDATKACLGNNFYSASATTSGTGQVSFTIACFAK